MCGRAAGGGGREVGRECTTKNKNPTERCGEKQLQYRSLVQHHTGWWFQSFWKNMSLSDWIIIPAIGETSLFRASQKDEKKLWLLWFHNFDGVSLLIPGHVWTQRNRWFYSPIPKGHPPVVPEGNGPSPFSKNHLWSSMTMFKKKVQPG